jgi:hypothetical protein
MTFLSNMGLRYSFNQIVKIGITQNINLVLNNCKQNYNLLHLKIQLIYYITLFYVILMNENSEWFLFTIFLDGLICMFTIKKKFIFGSYPLK